MRQILVSWPFQRLQHRGVGEGAIPFPWIAQFYARFVPYIAECLARRY